MILRKTLLGSGLLLVALACMGLFLASHAPARGGDTPAPTTAPAMVPPAPLHGPVKAEARQPEPTTPSGLYVPSAGLSVPLDALRVQNNSIDPPTYDTAYVVEDYSVPLTDTATGSVVIALHSRRDGTGLGNKLFNPATGEPHAAPGDLVMVEGIPYKVTETFALSRSEVQWRADLWASMPGRLVVFTCLQNAEGTRTGQNFVVLAQRTDPLASEMPI